MSSYATSYTILGYDFSEYRKKMLDMDWVWSDAGEPWVCGSREDHVQLFTDPMNGIDLYFGCVLSSKGEYDDTVTKISIENLNEKKAIVDAALQETGLQLPKEMPPYKLISFLEWT